MCIRDRFQNCEVFSDFETMIKTTKPELVDIIVPPLNHLKFIKIAARNKVDIICQKPFTTSIKEAKEAISFTKRKKVKIAVHENFRFQPWYIKIDEILKTSLLGDLYQVSFRMRPGDGQGEKAYLERQPYFQKMERFLIHETAIHLIDVIFVQKLSLPPISPTYSRLFHSVLCAHDQPLEPVSALCNLRGSLCNTQ